MNRLLYIVFATILAHTAGMAAPPRPELLGNPAFVERARELHRQPQSSANRTARLSGTAFASFLPAEKNVISLGSLRPLILLADFSDRPHDPTGHEPGNYAAMFFDNPGNSATPPNTVAEYLDEASYGALAIQGDAASVAPWVRMPSPLSSYLGNDQGLSGSAQLAAHTVAAADAFIDYTQFDNDGPDGVPDSGDDDGMVDALVLIHAGYGWEDSGEPGDIASHYRTVSIATADPAAGGGTIRVADLVVVPEESYKLDFVFNGVPGLGDPLEPIDNDNEPIAEIGVYAHELGHVLGLPDLYDTTFQSLGIGNWGLMGYGLWGPDYDGGVRPEASRLHNQPAHPGAWAKVELGWVTPTAIWTADEGFLLEPAALSPDARILYGDSEANEYFLLEHRSPKGYDAGFANSGGLLVWHVDETELQSGGAVPNNDSTRKGVDVECATGLDAQDKDELDNMLSFGALEHLFYQGTTFDEGSSPGTATNTGRVTEIRVGQLNGPTTGAQNLSGLASAGTVVLNPTGVLVRPGDGVLVVEWEPLPADSDVNGYRVYRSSGGGAETLEIDLEETATAYRIEGLGNGDLQTLRLVAYDTEFDFALGDFQESDGVVTFATPQPDPTAPALEAAPPAGVFGGPVTVTLTAVDDLDPAPDIVYSLDAPTPTVAYDGPVTIGATATLRYMATDATGNATAVLAGDYIIDTVPPVLTVVGADPLTVEAATSYTDPGATAIDDIAGDLTGAIQVNDPVDLLSPGTYLVTYNVSDTAGNTAVQASRTVHVVDTVPPAVSPPGDVTVEAAAPLTTVTLGTATATDAVGVASLLHDAPGAGFPVGATAVTWLATDTSGNQGLAVQTVTVADTTPPALALNGQNPQHLEAGTVYAESGATAADLVDGDLSGVVEIGGDPVDGGALGNYRVTYDVSDSRGNAAPTLTRAVTVADTTPPVITLLGDSPMQVEAGTAYLEPGATAEDGFEGDLSLSVAVGGDAVDTANPGTYRITYDVADSSGNQAPQATRTVTVVSPSGGGGGGGCFLQMLPR
ncbi:MAG: DUF5011 domain-containing protein [Deferrisomatales bacterium]|nr:DUF5011 domain-containing protein [Deferrisomatales bacterium]